MAERARQLTGLGRRRHLRCPPLGPPNQIRPSHIRPRHIRPRPSLAKRAQLHQVKPLMSPSASARTRAVTSTPTA